MVDPLPVSLASASVFLALSWPFVRTRPAGSVVAILFAVSFVGFVVCAWLAVPGAMDAF